MEKFVLNVIKANVIAAFFILIVQILSHFIKGKYSSMWKYFMWLMISLFLLVPVNPLNQIAPIRLELAQPAHLLPKSSPSSSTSDTLTGSVASVNGSGASSDTAGLPAGAGSAAVTNTSADTGKALADSSVRDSKITRLTKKPRIHTITVSSSRVSYYGLLQVFSLIWFAGILILTIYKTIVYRFSLSSLQRWSVPESDRRILEMYRYCCRKKHIGRPPRLMVSPKLFSPVLAGLKETRLYIPQTNYSMEELQLIFYHELSHYKCRDLWYKMLLLIVKTIYWFNPLLYVMAAEAEKDIENLCDSSVIETCEKPERQLYNQLLLKTAAFQNHVPYLATSLNDSTLIFKERILYMRNIALLNTRLTPALLLTAVLLCCNVALGCTIGAASTAQPDSYAAVPGDSDKGTSLTDFSRVNLDFPNISASADAGEAAVSPDPGKPGITPSEQTVYPTTTVNIRSGMGTQYDIIGTAPANTPLKQTGISDNGWSQIDWNGTTGYVSQAYITSTAPTADPKTAASVQTFSGSGTVIGTVLSATGAPLTGITVTIQTEDGAVASFTTGWHTTFSSDPESYPVGSTVKIVYLDSELLQIFHYTDPALAQNTSTIMGQIIASQNDLIVTVQSKNGTNDFFIGGVYGNNGYQIGDYVSLTYEGDLSNPKVVSMSIQDRSSVETADDTSSAEDTSSGSLLLYSGDFRDDIRYSALPDTPDYYGVQVTNVTKSSFDFSINRYSADHSVSPAGISGTAFYVGDGSSAHYSGDGCELYFTFTDGRATFPVVTEMVLSGFGPLEGTTLSNNSVPGYEFG